MHPTSTIGRHLANLQQIDRRMSSYASGYAGPAIRQATHALRSWKENAKAGSTDTEAAASALCEAAEAILARENRTFQTLIDHPWPDCMKTVRSLLRSAHRLAPELLCEEQRHIATHTTTACGTGA